MNEAGARAEDLCAELMRKSGLRVLARNWRCRHGEIDLVAEEGRTLVFAEVRYRRDRRFGGAAESVTAAKQARLIAAARLYLMRRPEADCRFDVLLLDSSRPAGSGGFAMRLLPSLLVAFLALPAHGQGVQFVVQSSPLAGFRYGEGAELWPRMQVGDALELRREPDNAHDPNAVRVEWRGRLLGYVPRRQNAAIAWGLERGTPLRARVSLLASHPNPARRIEFEVYIE